MLVARHSSILEIARASGRVEVDDLAARFEVSPQTIRKDLNELCEQGLLTRVHGGALLAFGVENLGYRARQAMAGAAKQEIGKAAAALIPDGASLFVNIGTTTEAVAQSLNRHRGLMVVTNNLNVASVMSPNGENEVVISGGVVRPADSGIVGEAAVDFVNQFKVDFAIVGVSALDEEGWLLDFDYREVKVAQAILRNARHVILVADQSKLDRSAPVRIANMSKIDSFVTDRVESADLRSVLEANDVRLVETQPDGTAEQDG
ncbi:DeoR/GlpR family DNA-binding transcription regulator [Polycladidibacter hongkongensis]|uniref:DeoR/GlpR family DNA-binding transcription regulator n=1 Tax=Polycladidibacter hongkongensis TaxID=1647556 RepID=UPI0008348128|nr:DeoR/GlpR family DNA-binding transcription regulator [Pseudovibrio hongkongensis]